jgi:amino acid adenylation domain-containing protein
VGILKAGAAYVPLDPVYPLQRRQAMLDDSGAQVVVAARDSAEFPAAITVTVEDLGHAPESDADVPETAAPDDLAYVIYTSGSTGRPKGVMVTHRNVLRLFESTRRWFDFNESDVWSLFHSYSFDFSVWEIWGALLHGGAIVVVPQSVSRSPDDFYRLLAETGVTVLSQTPSAFRQLLWAEEKLEKPAPLAVRWIVFGGEALDLPSLRPWFDRHAERGRLVNMYGITETTVHVTFREIRVEDTRPGTASLIGEPIPDLSLYVLDEHRELLPIGVPGELYVGGAGLARGYLNMPELTAQRFIPNPFVDEPDARLYRTGDLVRRRSDGDIEYLGRIDNQVQIRGFRVELGEVESVLSAQSGVQQAVVVARNFGDGDARLAAYVITSDALLDVERLRRSVQRELPDYMMPAAFVLLDRLPLTPNGKIDYAALPDAIVARTESAAAFVAPRTIVEQKVAAIWSEVLGMDKVGALDNFFDLGGHSLLGTRVASRLADEFGIDFPLKLFFEAPTVEAVAERVSQMLLGTAAADATDAPREEFEL